MTTPFPSDAAIAASIPLKPIAEIATQLGLTPDELIAQGHSKAKVSLNVLKRLQGKPHGAYVCVAGMTPTKFGEGKTTIAVGLTQALGAHCDQKVVATLRQPSMGPTFGMKGGAAGGGYSQVIPMEEVNLHLTGDLHAVSIANNLLCAALDTRVLHETRQKDEPLFDRLFPQGKDGKRPLPSHQQTRLKKLGIPVVDDANLLSGEHRRRLSRLDVDLTTIGIRRVVDVNDRMLRCITIGQGPEERFDRKTGFDIAVATELMAILALAADLADLRARIGSMVVAMSTHGDPVTAEDLGVAGACTALLRDALMPTLVQTLEHTPVLIHAGPFANIAHGNSSVVADRMALAAVGEKGLVVTEAGFGADIGFEKFANIKCRTSGLKPNCVVVVVTVRALAAHGEGAEDPLASGCSNMEAHVENCRKFGIPVVVAINRRTDDTAQQLAVVVDKAKAAGAVAAVPANCWALGGKGAVDLARAVITVCEGPPPPFNFLCPLSSSLTEKIEIVCKELYGAKEVEYKEGVVDKLDRFAKAGFGNLPVCIAKTQYSLSHDAALKGRPSGFTVPIQDARLAAGAGFVFLLCGPIMTMPGLPTRPAYFDIDVDVDTGAIQGLF